MVGDKWKVVIARPDKSGVLQPETVFVYAMSRKHVIKQCVKEYGKISVRTMQREW